MCPAIFITYTKRAILLPQRKRRPSNKKMPVTNTQPRPSSEKQKTKNRQDCLRHRCANTRASTFKLQQQGAHASNHCLFEAKREMRAHSTYRSTASFRARVESPNVACVARNSALNYTTVSRHEPTRYPKPSKMRCGSLLFHDTPQNIPS